MKILVLNAGSSSYKLAIYNFKNAPTKDPTNPIWEGSVTWGLKKNSYLINASLENGTFVGFPATFPKPSDALKVLLNTATNGTTKCLQALSKIDIVGHRVVHGGNSFLQPTLITPKVKKAIKKLFPLAPLHNPDNLKGIEIIEKLLPTTPQVAVFDTAFHHSLPQAASTYAGPYSWSEQGIKRYGFHGISHKYCSERCADLLQCDLNTLKIVTCHLGNGASLAAIDKGICIDTTMGFTPLDGLMMGTRCGSIDPGILLYLIQEKKLSAKHLFHTLNYESGLKGISGSTSDMRNILKLASKGNARAKLAYEMFILSLKRNLGAMIAVLGGVDAIVFTAGIGENAPQIRIDTCNAFQHMGLILDDKKNTQTNSDRLISSKNSRIHVLVVHTKEDWSIARSCWLLAQHLHH